jgi:CHAT domain-containing protein/tetratricopeptide (TPR) repeat protein
VSRYLALLAALIGCLAITGRSHSVAADEKDPVYRFGSKQSYDGARYVHEQLWLKNRFAEAAEAAARGAETMRAQGRIRACIWYLNILGGCRLQTRDLCGAMDAYIEERDLALTNGLPVEAATALSNLSALYLNVNDSDSSLVAAKEAVATLIGGRNWDERSKALLQLGRVLLARGEGTAAAPYFLRVIRETQQPLLEAWAWDLLGFELSKAGDYARAEVALLNAFRIRRLKRDPALFATEQKLAKLYFETGNVERARSLIDAAFANRRGDDDQVPQALMFITRARIRNAQGELEGALDDSVQAVQAAEARWRSGNPFADDFRVNSDIALEKMIYASAVDIAATLSSRIGDPKYADIAWQLCERNRAASLRQTIVNGAEWTRRVLPAYWKLLARLREVEAGQLGNTREAQSTGDEALRLRMRLSEMESTARAAQGQRAFVPASLGTGRFSGQNPRSQVQFGESFLYKISLKDFRKVVGPQRKYISFRLGEAVSYRWVIDQRKMELQILPGRRQFVAEIRRFRDAAEGGDPAAEPLGAKLYALLFAGVEHGDSDRWDIALDEELFDLPLGALVCGKDPNGRPVYLAERRALQITPGAWAVGANDAASRDGAFAGIGDAIYNTADARYKRLNSGPITWFSFAPALLAANTPLPRFARLAGSGEEVKRAATVAGGPAVLLTGARVNRAEVLAVLAGHPRIVHVAAHFVEGQRGEPAVVLGLQPRGFGRPQIELLTAKDIASLDVPGAVVILSGCSSGAGRVVPSAGVLGLARAWLSAGARAVVATHWPTTDGAGDLFERLYRHLTGFDGTGTVAPAEALRRAQVDMLRSGGSRSDTRNWAAYQLIGRSN